MPPPPTFKKPFEMTHLDELESQSIYLMREAFHGFQKPAMLWSMGKDSNVLLWLAKKAFCGHMPFPVVHIDTTYEFPEMLEFRSWAQKHYGFELTVWINKEARARGIGYETTDPVTVTHELKTVALQQCLAANGYDALITPALAQRPLPLGSLDTSASDGWSTFRRSGLFTPFTAVFNLSGLPAISLPLFDGEDGLPLAVQVVGRPAAEGDLLALAAALEAAAPARTARPQIS